MLGERVNGHPLIYLDSAATTQRPRAVLDALANFYLHDNANPAKSLHTLARRSATLYEKAKETVARFVHARGPQEIVWTRGTTEAINPVASSWGGASLRSGDEIILTVSEHYSSLVEVKGLRILGPTEPRDRVSVFPSSSRTCRCSML